MSIASGVATSMAGVFVSNPLQLPLAALTLPCVLPAKAPTVLLPAGLTSHSCVHPAWLARPPHPLLPASLPPFSDPHCLPPSPTNGYRLRTRPRILAPSTHNLNSVCECTRHCSGGLCQPGVWRASAAPHSGGPGRLPPQDTGPGDPLPPPPPRVQPFSTGGVAKHLAIDLQLMLQCSAAKYWITAKVQMQPQAAGSLRD